MPLVLGGVRAGWASLDVVLRALTSGPAGILGIDVPDDRIVMDTEAEWTVSARDLVSKGKNTPLLGRIVVGRVTDVEMRRDREVAKDAQTLASR